MYSKARMQSAPDACQNIFLTSNAIHMYRRSSVGTPCSSLSTTPMCRIMAKMPGQSVCEPIIHLPGTRMYFRTVAAATPKLDDMGAVGSLLAAQTGRAPNLYFSVHSLGVAFMFTRHVIMESSTGSGGGARMGVPRGRMPEVSPVRDIEGPIAMLRGRRGNKGDRG